MLLTICIVEKICIDVDTMIFNISMIFCKMIHDARMSKLIELILSQKCHDKFCVVKEVLSKRLENF